MTLIEKIFGKTKKGKPLFFNKNGKLYVGFRENSGKITGVQEIKQKKIDEWIDE